MGLSLFDVGLSVFSNVIIPYYTFGSATTGHSLGVSGDVLIAGKLEVDGVAFFDTGITLAEISTPSAVDNFGKIYPKTDDRLYFQDGAGNEHEIVEVDVEHGEMFLDGNGTPVTVTTKDDSVALEGFSSSHLQDFTFVSSKNGTITDTANNGGKLRITDATHGLTTGDIITINGLFTAAQNGTTAITKITNDIFDCDDINWVTDDETGTWQMGSYLLVPTGGAGTYMASMTSSATSGGANKTFLVQLCINIAAQPDVKVERKFSAADIGSVGMNGLITLAAANRIWLSVTGLSDTTDITFKHANLSLHRI